MSTRFGKRKDRTTYQISRTCCLTRASALARIETSVAICNWLSCAGRNVRTPLAGTVGETSEKSQGYQNIGKLERGNKGIKIGKKKLSARNVPGRIRKSWTTDRSRTRGESEEDKCQTFDGNHSDIGL